MGQALYRKYRSRNLAEIVGQEHITRALERAISTKNISHAYLFTGPRGVGKTSIARIMAHEVNNLPYTDESNHLDIIEIDAASNRRIDEVRDLREKVHIAPTSAKYKVYIIDEVHMLTREAFNALLKTLEEPPAHVIFILATTEIHKLPETIISRTQHYAFKPIDFNQVTDHLKDIADKEKIKIDGEALELIAQHGVGSFRDSISLLDQIRNYSENITLNDVQSMIGVAPKNAVDSIIKSIIARDANLLVDKLQQLRSQGIETGILAKQIGSELRTQLLDGSLNLDNHEALVLLDRLIEVPASANPFAALEISLLNVIFNDNQTDNQSTKTRSVKSAEIEEDLNKKVIKKTAAINTKDSSALKTVDDELKLEEKPIVTAEKSSHAQLNEELWAEVLAHIKQQYNTMYGVLRMAEPSFDGSTLTLTFQFAFHQKRINDPKQKKIITDAMHEFSGINIDLVCITGTIHKPKNTKKSDSSSKDKTENNSAIGDISNIFGGGELLES